MTMINALDVMIKVAAIAIKAMLIVGISAAVLMLIALLIVVVKELRK